MHLNNVPMRDRVAANAQGQPLEGTARNNSGQTNDTYEINISLEAWRVRLSGHLRSTVTCDWYEEGKSLENMGSGERPLRHTTYYPGLSIALALLGLLFYMEGDDFVAEAQYRGGKDGPDYKALVCAVTAPSPDFTAPARLREMQRIREIVCP